jgi:PAS domain S-box-containing protein
MRISGITYKLFVVYLIIAIPLLSVISVIYFSWYDGEVDRLLLERREVAKLAVTSFTFFLKDVDRSMKLVGESIVENRYPTEKATRSLAVLLPIYPANYILMTDAMGKVVISTEPQLSGKNLSKDPAFIAIISNNKQTGISPSEGPKGNRGFYSTQAIKQNGKLQSIVALFIDISKLNKALMVKSVGGGINIVDSSGYLVYQSERPHLADTAHYWRKFDFIKTALSGKSASSTGWLSPVNNRVRIVVEEPIPQIGWAAGSGIDRDKAFAPINRTAITTAIMIIAFMLAALLISTKISRRIIRSLTALLHASKAVGEEDFDEPILIETGDEIEEVAQSLDKARLNLKSKVEELRKARDEMEIRVDERTAELSSLTSRMQSLLESTDEGICGIDDHERCTFINRSAIKMLGYDPEDVLGKNMHDLVHYKKNDNSPYPLDECPIIKTIRTGKGVRLDNEIFIRKDGTAFPVEYSAFPVVEDEVAKGAVISFSDITERKQVEHLRLALTEIGEIINSTLDYDEILKKIVEESTKAIGAESGLVGIHNDGYWEVQCAYMLPHEVIGLRVHDYEHPLTETIAHTKQIIAISDISDVSGVSAKTMRQLNIRSALLIPLIVRGKVVGSISFNYHTKAMRFTDVQLDFAQRLSTSTSLALENARLYETERNIADTLQEALLQIPDELPSVEFSRLYRSATETTRVGGDFFDIFELAGDRIAIVIGDISGKGLEAATSTALVKNTIRAYAYDGLTVDQIMSKTNDVIFKVTAPSLFVTVFFGILETKTGALAYCSGGHPPALIKRPSSVETLAENSPIVGAFADLPFYEDISVLGPTDALILYTDGLIEARGKVGFFGDERLINTMSRIEGSSIQEIPQVIFKEVSKFSGGLLSDDLAILVVGYKR